jgi:hypothetical protein
MSKFCKKLFITFLISNLFIPAALASPATDKFRDNLTSLRNSLDRDLRKVAKDSLELSEKDIVDLMTLTNDDHFAAAFADYLEGCSKQVLGLDALITILGGKPLYPEYTIKYLKDNGYLQKH